MKFHLVGDVAFHHASVHDACRTRRVSAAAAHVKENAASRKTMNANNRSSNACDLAISAIDLALVFASGRDECTKALMHRRVWCV